MAGYRVELIELFENQLRRSPKPLLVEQIGRLHDLVTVEFQDDETYRYQEICEKVTDFRPEKNADALLEGRDLRADLSELLLALSKLVELIPEDSPEPVYSLSEVCGTYGVGGRIVFGWLARGLVGMEYVFGDSRRALGFRFSALRRFEDENPGLVGKHSLFALVSRTDRDQVIRQANRHLHEGQADFDQICEVVSRERAQSLQLVRYVLRNYAEQHPASPLARNLPPPLTGQDKADIATAYEQGATLKELATRYGRSVRAIYFIICQQQAEEILSKPINFMRNPLFDKPEADAIILGGKEIGTRTRAQEVLGKPRTSDDVPLHLKGLKARKLLTREQEVDLFRRYNFLKYRVSQLRETLRSSEPSARLIQQIKALQAQADQCRETIVRSNLGLVISTARKHLWGGTDFETLVADGNLSLMQAVEKFDYSRGNRFSTYASWAIMKNYAKNIPEERYHLHTFFTGASELLGQLDARSVGGPGQVGLKRSISRLLERLEDRERQVIASRFGLTDGTARETLAEVGKRLSLSKERVRQIERQALEKLRKILES